MPNKTGRHHQDNGRHTLPTHPPEPSSGAPQTNDRDADCHPGEPAYVTRRKPDLLRRLRRVEGQVRGLQRMVETDKYCADVLTQVAAVRAALDQVGVMLLEDHTRGCVAQALQTGDDSYGRPDDMIDELLGLVKRFVR